MRSNCVREPNHGRRVLSNKDELMKVVEVEHANGIRQLILSRWTTNLGLAVLISLTVVQA